VGAELWPLPWISPRHALLLITFLLLPLVQVASAAAILNLIRRRAHHPDVAWSGLVLTTVLPLAVLALGVRWFGFSQAALDLDMVLWPVWVGLGIGLALMGIGAALDRFRPARPAAPGLAAAGGALAVVCWALLSSFQIAPGAWLEGRTLQLAIQPPAFLPILSTHLVSSVSLGAALALRSMPSHVGARVAAALSAALGCLLVVSAPWWLPPQVVPAWSRDTLELGTHTPGASGWAIVALFPWASFALASHIRPRGVERHVPLALVVLVAIACQGLWAAHREPWAVRGWIYENGTMVERVRTARRSPVLTSPEKDRAGELMFLRQCATCHARTGPLASWRAGLGHDAVEIRSWMETLRDADRPGHPYEPTMPPLLGSDAEMDALTSFVAEPAASGGIAGGQAHVPKPSPYRWFIVLGFLGGVLATAWRMRLRARTSSGR
jgi:mono/diheme cytochrome c family protein